MLAAYKNLVWSVVNLVNAPRGRTYQQQRDRLLLTGKQRQQFVATAQQIVANQLALGSLAELSIRLSDNSLAITANRSYLANLAEEDIVTCPINMDQPPETAALHLPWHHQIYRHTPAQAALLGHPPYAVTLANAGQLPDENLMPEMWNLVGGVALLPSAELSLAALAQAVQRYPAVLVPHIGALVWGDSLTHVLARTQALEYLSRLTSLANRTI